MAAFYGRQNWADPAACALQAAGRGRTTVRPKGGETCRRVDAYVI